MNVSKKRKRTPVDLGDETVQPEASPKRPLDKGKGKVGEVPAEVVVSTDGGEGNVVRTLRLYKPILSFRGEDFLTLFQSLCNQEERDRLAQTSDLLDMQTLSTSLVETGVRVGSIAEKLVKVESLETALDEANARIASLEERLKASDTQVQQAVEAKSVAEFEAEKHKAELQRLQSNMKAFEDNLAIREDLVAKGKKAIDDGQRDLDAKTEQFRLEVRDWLVKFWKGQKSSYQRQGAFSFRLHFLTSPMGQEFLRIMHQDLLAEYRRTTEFARAAGKGFGILIAEAIQAACQQMEVTPDQEGKLDTKQILAQMDVDRVNAGLGIQSDKPANWWIPVMEKAARVLIESDKNDPDLPAGCLYDLPYLGTLTFERLEEVGRRKVTSGESDLSAGAIKIIDQLAGSEKLHVEETVGPEDPNEATSSIRMDARPSGQDDAPGGPSQL